jgi:hypothetical protein
MWLLSQALHVVTLPDPACGNVVTLSGLTLVILSGPAFVNFIRSIMWLLYRVNHVVTLSDTACNNILGLACGYSVRSCMW